MSAEMDPVGLWLYQEHARPWFKKRTEDSQQFIIWMGSHRKGNWTADMVYDSGSQKDGYRLYPYDPNPPGNPRNKLMGAPYVNPSF